MLAQLDVLRYWKESTAYKNDLQLLPKEIDDDVANLHLPALGSELNVFTQER